MSKVELGVKSLVENCSHNSALPCLRAFLGIPSTQFIIWIYSLWTTLSIVPESCLCSRWTSPFSLQGCPGTANAEFSTALDLEGRDRQSRSGTDWAPDDQPHHRQGLMGWCVVDSNNLSTRQCSSLLLLGTFGPWSLPGIACMPCAGGAGKGHRTKCFSHEKHVTCIHKSLLLTVAQSLHQCWSPERTLRDWGQVLVQGEDDQGGKKNSSTQGGVVWQPRGPGCLLSYRMVEGKPCIHLL